MSSTTKNDKFSIMPWDYSEKTEKLFLDAIAKKAGTHIGEIENADGLGFHGSLVCGDALKLTFKVNKAADPLQDKISEVKYMTFGCTSAIAASEALCILLEAGDYTPIKALELTKNDIVKFLEGLPTQKIHCSIMGVEALHLAVKDWASKRNVDLKKLGINIVSEDEHTTTDDSPVVCRCLGIRKNFLYNEIKRLSLNTVDEVTDVLKAGSVCGTCKYEPNGIQDIINEINESKIKETKSEKTPFQIAKQIEEVVTKEIAPTLAKDGGGLEIIEIRGNILYFRLKGNCTHCISANNTIKYTIEKTLKDKVDPNVKAINVD